MERAQSCWSGRFCPWRPRRRDQMAGKEIHDCSQRILVAKLLREKTVYSRIAQHTGASTATISRVNRCCAYGAGGYQTVLDRIGEA